MSETELIKTSSNPEVYSSLKNKFKKVGIKKGMTVIVHSSLNSLGWVCGGASTVIQALQDVLTEEGTLVMPTHTTNLSNPNEWFNPPIPKEWTKKIIDEMPCFDKEKTPSYFMGIIPELFRNFPGVLRSNHPMYSFAAYGKNAKYIVENHSLNYSLGDMSPLSKIYKLNGHVLLIGVDYDNNTSMHLGEYRSNKLNTLSVDYPFKKAEKTIWKSYKDIDYDEDRFMKIGKEFEKTHFVSSIPIHKGKIKLINQRSIVDFTKNYIVNHLK